MLGQCRANIGNYKKQAFHQKLNKLVKNINFKILSRPVHPTPWETPSITIWAILTMTVLQTKRYRFELTVLHLGPEVVLDICLFRPNLNSLLPSGLTLCPYNLVMIAAAASEIWGLMTFQ